MKRPTVAAATIAILIAIVTYDVVTDDEDTTTTRPIYTTTTAVRSEPIADTAVSTDTKLDLALILARQEYPLLNDVTDAALMRVADTACTAFDSGAP